MYQDMNKDPMSRSLDSEVKSEFGPNSSSVDSGQGIGDVIF